MAGQTNMSGIGSLIGTGTGAYFGGPTGAVVGGSIGSAVGNAFGSDGRDSGSDTIARYAAMFNLQNAYDYSAQLGTMRDEYNAGEQQALDQYEAYYGNVEQNLSDYYNNLNPAKFAQQYKTSLQDHLNKQVQQYTDSLASRGLMSSGMRNQAMKEQAFAQAQGNAQADINAPEDVRQMQQAWGDRGQQMLDSNLNRNTNSVNFNQNLLSLGTQAEMNAMSNLGNVIAGQGANNTLLNSNAIQNQNQMFGEMAGAFTSGYNPQSNTPNSATSYGAQSGQAPQSINPDY